MASPIQYYIIPDCGIDFDIVDDNDHDDSAHQYSTDLRTPRKYKIKEEVLRSFLVEDEAVRKLDKMAKLVNEDCPDISRHLDRGKLFPLSPISLSRHSMDIAGIKNNSRYYAYIHPPSNLSDFFDYSQHTCFYDEAELLPTSPRVKCLGIANFAVFGGFAYFDKDYKLVSVNALCLKRTQHKLCLRGPYETNDEVSKAMVDLDRSSPILLTVLQEAGFVAKSFVRPKEMLKGKYAVNKDLSKNGTFIYHRDDGTSLAYVVTQHIDNADGMDWSSQGISDSFHSIPLLKEFKFSKKYVRHDDFDRCSKAALKEKPHSGAEDGYPRLHQALKMKLPLADIVTIVAEETDYNDGKDKFGWSALHYACRFNADNFELIAWLLSKGFKNEPDGLGRYPLHLACDSSPSLEVISFLLFVSNYSNDNLISKPTSCLSRLPLHIACNAGATKDVIEALMSSDEKGHEEVIDFAICRLDSSIVEIDTLKSIRAYFVQKTRTMNKKRDSDRIGRERSSLTQRTLVGRTPLHLAIVARLPHETIKLLVDDYTVCQWYGGMLPLHMAIMNGYGEETIQLLLEKDRKGSTLAHSLTFDESSYGSGSTNGGAMAISGGIGSTGLEGSVSIESGVGTAATSGDATLSTAAGGTAGDSGAMLIQTGTASNGDSGSLTLATGASASGDAGDMTVTVEDSKRSRNSQETESQNLLDMQLVEERPTDTSLFNCSTNSYHPAQDNNLEEKSEVNEFHRYLTEYTKHLHGTRALHLCLRKKSIDGARLILQREMQMGLRGCEGKTSLVLNQLDQRSALHMACAINCEVDVIKLILERDPTRSVTTWTDVTGSTPLHLACAHGDARHEVVKELLEADAKRIKLQTNKTSRKSCVDPSVCKQSIEILDRHNRNPLARAVQENAPTEVLRLFLKPLNFKADGFGEKEISVLARRIKKDVTLQREMTAVLAQRMPFFLLCVQLVANVLAVIAFLFQIENVISSGSDDSKWSIFSLIICLVIFGIREVIQFFSKGFRYFCNAENIFDIGTMISMSLSIHKFLYCDTSVLEFKATNDKDDWSANQIWWLVTTILLILHLIFSLRSAFLPFARFVGGLKVIVLALLPFFIVSTAILLGFTAAFRIKFKMHDGGKDDKVIIIEKCGNDDNIIEKCGNDDNTMECKCIDNFENCMYGTLEAFFSGGDVVSWMDISFGIIAVVILLNVVIAVVSSAWEGATDYATDIYWRGRIAFLSENSCVYNLSYNRRSSRCEAFFTRLDNINCLFLNNTKVSWSTQHPYCLVKDKNTYDRPSYYLTETEAVEIEKAKSFETDFYWLSVSESNKTRSTIKAILLWLKWLLLTLFHVALVAIGFALFGVFLPNPYREKILSFGSENEESLESFGSENEESVELTVERLVNENMKKYAHIIEAGERSKRTGTGMEKIARPTRFQSV